MYSNLDFTLYELKKILSFKGQHSVYVSCFYKEPDILSQWRAYAEDGKGVSIGFDLKKISKADNLLIREVIYIDDIVSDETVVDVLGVASTIMTIIKEENIVNKDEQIEVFLHELIPELAKYKNPAFKEEKEVRLIFCDDMKFEKIIDKYNAFIEKLEAIELEHDFRTVGEDDITEFLKLPFSKEAIKEIYVGPKCLLSEYDVKNILKKLLNLDVKVIKSKSSYK